MSVLQNLEQLVTSFCRDVEIAKGLQSCNVEDDLESKLSIVGFSYNAPTQEWGKGHFDFVKSHMFSEFDDDSLDEYGDNAENVRLFVALAVGYLLGLLQQDLMDEAQFKLAERQLPGVVMLHLPEITRQSV